MVGDREFRESTFSSLFCAIAQEYHDNECLVVVGKGSVTRKTFGEFAADCAVAADDLQNNPCGQCMTVGFNTYGHVTCIIGTMLSSKELVVIGPSSSSLFLAERMDQFSSSAVYCDERLVTQVHGHAFPAGRQDKVQSSFWSQPPRKPKGRFISVFTSGSTGRSRVVEQSERAALNNAADVIGHHRLGPGVTVGTALPVSHVNALHFGLVATLLSGGRLILFESFSSDQIFNWCQSERIDIFSTVAPQLSALLGGAHDRRAQVKSLRYFLSAATALPKETVIRLRNELGKRVVLGYGLSEATNFSCTLPIDLDDREYREAMEEFAVPSIGIALPSSEVRIVDANGDECLEKEEGEIQIRGDSLMNGYRDCRENPFAGEWLRTGDVGFFANMNGRKLFYFCKREKDVIKRNGESIGLREIDDVVAGLGLQDIDAISVSFPNCFTGEEIGLVFRAGGGAPEGWFEHAKSALECRLPREWWPKICFSVTEPIRNASGKPARGAFDHHFRPYLNSVIPLVIMRVEE